ncbi:Acyl-coenzyme A thioesterase 13 [Spatholobus suberectus]|nr:Acyl-coenzyme A thioesterase 13 [Spatholobus suberectus]
MVEKEMEDSSLEVTRKFIKGLADGTLSHEIEALTTTGIQVVKAHKGFLLCDFIIHSGLLDENGNWHVSAIATLVDIIANCASYTFTSCHQVTLDFSISYYSTANVQEEVEIEAKVIGKKDELTSVIVEVKKKQNGELVALGKLWMAVARRNPRHQASKL